MPIEVTDNYIRIRVRNPDDFEKKGMKDGADFATIWIDKDNGIKGLLGKIKGTDSTTIGSFLFEKEKWTLEKAKKYIVNSDYKIQSEDQDLPENIIEFLDMKGGEKRDYVVAEVGVDLPEELLNELIKNYDPKLSEAPVTISHPDPKIKNPFAWGWVKGLFKKGKQMVASMDFSKEFCEMFDKGFLRKKSIAYRDKFDKIAKPYLVHVAFLGSELPRIKGMPDEAINRSLLSLSDDSDLKTIYLKERKMDYTKEQVDQLVSDARIAARAEVLAEMKSEINKFSDENKNLVIKTKELETNHLKELSEKDKIINALTTEKDNAEVIAFVDKMASKDFAKIMPKDKAEKVKRLLKAKSLDEALYKELKDDIEKSPKLIEFSEIEDASGDEKSNSGITKEEKSLGLTNTDISEYADFDISRHIQMIQRPKGIRG